MRLWRDLACAAVALALGLFLVLAAVAPFQGRPSVLVRIVETEPTAALVATDPAWVYAGSHYDGIYYFAIALDPFAAGRPHTLIDLAAYRYGHPAYGWLAGMLALGHQDLVPLALVVISLVSMAVGAFFGSRIAGLLGLPRWTGLAIALSPCLLAAIAADTSEVLGTALLLAVLWAWLVQRFQLAGLLIVPMCFVKEPLLLVPVGLAIWEFVQLGRGTPGSGWVLRLAWLVPGPLAYLAWLNYLHGVFGVWSFAEGGNMAFPVPLAGWIDSIGRAASMAAGGFWDTQVGAAVLPIQVVVLAILLFTVTRAIRVRTPLDPVYLLVALLMFYMSWWQLQYPKDLLRCVAFALALAALVMPRPTTTSRPAAPQPAVAPPVVPAAATSG